MKLPKITGAAVMGIGSALLLLRRPAHASVKPIVVLKNSARSNVKSFPHGPLSEKTIVEIHQTDGPGSDRASGWANIKTNLGIANDGTVFVVHPLNADVVKNYSDMIHIEVGGQFPALISSRQSKYYDSGKAFDRTHSKRLGDAQKEGIRTALGYIKKAFRAAGLKLPLVVGHLQTYNQRVFDPGGEVFRYAISQAKQMGFPIDFEFTRGSGIPVHADWRHW